MDCELIGWCALRPEVQAAWVQAVFSVIGIFIAVLVPWLQHRKASQIRASEASVKAVARAAVLLKGTKELCARIERSRAYFDANRPVAGGTHVPHVAIPQSVMDQAAFIPELGTPGAHLIKAINHSLELRDLLDGDMLLFPTNTEQFSSRLMAAKKHADEALAGIRLILE